MQLEGKQNMRPNAEELDAGSKGEETFCVFCLQVTSLGRSRCRYTFSDNRTGIKLFEFI